MKLSRNLVEKQHFVLHKYIFSCFPILLIILWLPRFFFWPLCDRKWIDKGLMCAFNITVHWISLFLWLFWLFKDVSLHLQNLLWELFCTISRKQTLQTKLFKLKTKKNNQGINHCNCSSTSFQRIWWSHFTDKSLHCVLWGIKKTPMSNITSKEVLLYFGSKYPGSFSLDCTFIRILLCWKEQLYLVLEPNSSLGIFLSAWRRWGEGRRVSRYRDSDISGAFGAAYLHRISQLPWHFLKWATHYQTRKSQGILREVF